MNFAIEFEQEVDGRWIADAPSFPGLMAYGATQEEAETNLNCLAISMQSFASVWSNPEDASTMPCKTP